MARRVGEIGDRIAAALGHRHDPMHGGLVLIVGPDLHGVAEVDDDGVGQGWHVDPSVGGGFCLESAGVVLEEQGEHTRIGVVAEGGWSEFGEPLALIGRHRIADGVVVEANGRGRALIEEAEFFGGVFVAEAERVADHAERVGRELRERVVELGERCLELVVPCRPTVELTCRS